MAGATYRDFIEKSVHATINFEESFFASRYRVTERSREKMHLQVVGEMQLKL
jgi:hypothetical protein